MKEPIASLYPEALEAAVREKGPIAVLRDVLQTVLVVKHDLPGDDAWHYASVVWELQAVLLRLATHSSLLEGANERIRKAAA